MFLRLCCVLLLLASSPSLQASAELEESDITNLDRAGTIADLKGCNNQTVDRVEALGGSDSKEKKKKQREKEKREKKKARKKRRREKRRKRKEEKEKEKENDRFTPAKPLDFFRDIDPSIFKWSNPDQIQPGTTTCGFFYPPLGSNPELTYPTVEVYVCMRFAKKQPAPRGNLFLHCGGPGSLSWCEFLLGGKDYLGFDSRQSYNLITIDQRGMGRSEPNFIRDECKLLERNQAGQIISNKDPIRNVDVTSRLSIREYLDQVKLRNEACWNCSDCGFQLSAEQRDGTRKTFNFLEYSGTRQLAEDINRFRKLIGAEKLSLYGASYGGMVMATFATMFSQRTDLLVIDSTGPVKSDIYDFALGIASMTDLRIDFVIYSCTYRNMMDPGTCPVDDMNVCLKNIDKLLEDVYGDYLAKRDAFWEIIRWMGENIDQAQPICTAAAEGNPAPILETLRTVREAPEDNEDNEEERVPSKPTFEFSGDLPLDIVFAQDLAGHVYDDDYFIDRTFEVGEKYDGAGTDYPVYNFIENYIPGFYWPRSTPIPPSGNPRQKGIVAGQLYDLAVPYRWTQETKARFPACKLLTSQSYNHVMGMAADGGACQRLIQNYFKTGKIGFNDGEVCGSEFPPFSVLLEAEPLLDG